MRRSMSFSQGKIHFLLNAIMEFAMLTGRRIMLWLNIVPIEEIMGLIQLPHIPIEKLILANLITTPACAELIRNSTMLRAQFNCLVGGCQSTWCLVHWCELFNTAQLNWLVLLVLGWYNELINSEQVGLQLQYCSVQPYLVLGTILLKQSALRYCSV